ncbi:MAG: flagellar biosynthesis protein FlhB [Alphaproteobacteria bacterium]
MERRDESQKTEEPTPRRLEDARRKGDVVQSREVSNWFMLLAAAIMVSLMLPWMVTDIAGTLRPFLAEPHIIVVERRVLLGGLIEQVGWVLAFPLALFVIAALASGISQTGLVLTAERIKPNPSKISPVAGLRRLFSLRALTELAKGLLKLVIVAGIAVSLTLPLVGVLELIPAMPIPAAVKTLHSTGVRVTIGVVAALTLLMFADFLYQRYEHRKKLRMSKEEVKDELKQTEGDPQIKARLRSIRAERARQRMMQAVPEADVVITNPTHFAIALSYDHDTMPAPKVVAKGVDSLAMRIREVAEEHDVPLVENPPLARSLHDSVEVDQDIKPEHYQAVAEVIAYVMRLRGQNVAAQRAP